jgi:prolyl 4-hydroxylase
LQVLSCAPRVYLIDNFLSEVEVDHFIDLATGMKLQRSTTSGNFGDSSTSKNDVASTRTSENTWVHRHTSPLIDTIYRRAADLLHIDEALLRHRTADEYPELKSKKSIAESLQVVHYGVGQEYTAHHDFGKRKFQFVFFVQRLVASNVSLLIHVILLLRSLPAYTRRAPVRSVCHVASLPK